MPGFDAAGCAAAITAELRALGSPERAIAERAYLKSDLEFFGTTVPATRAVVMGFLRSERPLHDELLAVCAALWPVPSEQPPAHEQRMAAVLLLEARPKLLGIADVAALERWIRAAGTWALVDTLAGHVMARIVAADSEALAVLDRWVTDADFWVRRSAVLGLMAVLREGRELKRFFGYADALLDEREFFIRKALGWVARDLARRRPDEVSAWVRRNLGRMNGVTIREAVKYLPDGPELMAVWRGGVS